VPPGPQDAEDLRESLKGIYKSALPIAPTLAPFAESIRGHNKVRPHPAGVGDARAVPWQPLMRARPSIVVRERVGRAQAVQGFVDQLEPGQPTDSLRSAMSNTVRLQEHLLTGLDEMAKGLDTLVIQPQQAFVKKDIRDARYFSHEFLKVRRSLITRCSHSRTRARVPIHTRARVLIRTHAHVSQSAHARVSLSLPSSSRSSSPSPYSLP